MLIRPIQPSSKEEITLVALRMRETLNEVLGPERGTSMYSLDWLQDRVRFHVDPERCEGQVFVAVAPDGVILGHAIIRLEELEGEGPIGLFSTLFVDVNHRRAGVATALMATVEDWLQSKKRTRVVYHTATSNHKLIQLFQKRGYNIALSTEDMVRLVKNLYSIRT